jgi:integrase
VSNAVTLHQLIENHQWRDIPAKFVTRDGQLVTTDGDGWVIAAPQGVERLRFQNIKNPVLRWAIMRYVLHRLETVSNNAGITAYRQVVGPSLSDFSRNERRSASFEDAVGTHMEAQIKSARNRQKLWEIYGLTRWYIWCAEIFPEAGFSVEYAHELEAMVIPGQPKGEAIRLDDPEDGPLDHTLELPLVRRALEQDACQRYESVEQRAALALCLAFGRNAANYAFLDVDDLVDVTEGVRGVPPTYTLRIPRIKKRLVHPRDDFLVEPMDARLAIHVLRLARANADRKVTVLTEAGRRSVEIRPLFHNPRTNYVPVPEAVLERAARIPSGRITDLLHAFARRTRLMSPVTGEPLRITPRRLRYTLATGLVEEGISRKELARLLDHTDTQHVRVYFDLKSRIVRKLDAAAAKKFAPLLDFFKGKVVDRIEGEASGQSSVFFVDESRPSDLKSIGSCGKKRLCHLDPPFSCYLCEKFEPYRHADHEAVLARMLKEREDRLQKYEDARLGVQLDDVIIAVAQVCEMCKEARS